MCQDLTHQTFIEHPSGIDYAPTVCWALIHHTSAKHLLCGAEPSEGPQHWMAGYLTMLGGCETGC